MRAGAARLEEDLARIEETVALKPPRPAHAPAVLPIGLALIRGHAKHAHREVPVLASLTRTAWAGLHGFGLGGEAAGLRN